MEPSFSPAWFATFGRRDEAETAREVALLLSVLPPPPASVLDVPCGFGRHAHALAARGYSVSGVEREAAVAAEARAGGVEVHELDLRRLDLLPGTFDAVICMWASFGWYDDETNAAVFAAMAEKARTTLVLDVYDPLFFRGRDGVRENRGVRDEKRVVGNRLVTTLTYTDGSRDEFEWRLYEPEELRALGAACGLRLDDPPNGGGETPRAQYVFRRDTRRQVPAPGRERYDDICDALTTWHEDVRRSVIFGMPCLKKSGRVIAGFPRSGGGMVFRLPDPDAHARALALPGAHLFDPAAQPPVRESGPVEGVRGNREVPPTPTSTRRPFKQWVVVPPEQADEWEALAMDALRGQAPRWENHEPASSSR